VSRAKLGQKVFEKAEELRELERLIHPRVKARMLQEIEAAREEARVRLIVIDAPLLFEAGLAAWCDHRIFVDAPRSARLGWLARRQGWDEAAVEKRERAQLPLEEKRSKSDYFVGNFGSMEGLERQVSELYEVLTSA
jgi:dephospho-CoA kinase